MSTNDRLERKAPAVQNFHRIEVHLSGDLRGEITLNGVCDAPEGTSCRMWCDSDLCSDGYQEGHEAHDLFDQGECGIISCLNGDTSCIPELYEGPETRLRSDFIDLSWDSDGVTWSYSDDAPAILTANDLAELEEYRRRDEAGRIEYGIQADNAADGSLESNNNTGLNLRSALHLRNVAKKKGFAAQVMQRTHPAASEWVPTLGPVCEITCRHECGECRLGLGSHLTCDPRCEHHLPAANQ